MAINIQEILHPSDSDSIKFEKINYNFDQILANGGGPIGPKGQKGDQGLVGSTGQKGDKGDKGDTGLQGESGASDSPWYKVEIDGNNDGNNEITILKPKRGTDLNIPIIWLGDDTFTEDVNNGEVDTNARLTIAKDNIFENYIKLHHASDKGLVLTSSEEAGFSKFNFQNAFGSTSLEFGITTDKITFYANTAPFTVHGSGINLKSLGSTNIKLETGGTGILDVDINADFKGYLKLPTGTTGQRPTTPQVGMIRFNTNLDIVESYYDNGGSPIWRELCTDCGSAVADSIGIIGGIIDANADGSPRNNTISISGGNIDAIADGSPVSNATITRTGSANTNVVYNSPQTVYLLYSITPTSVDPGPNDTTVSDTGLTITNEPSNNRLKVITSTRAVGLAWTITVKHPDDASKTISWTITPISANSPTPTPTSGSGAGPTATPVPPTPTPTSGSGSGPTPTFTFATNTTSGNRFIFAPLSSYTDVAYTIIGDGISSPATPSNFSTTGVSGTNQSGPTGSNDNITFTGVYRFTKTMSPVSDLNVNCIVDAAYNTSDTWYCTLESGSVK